MKPKERKPFQSTRKTENIISPQKKITPTHKTSATHNIDNNQPITSESDFSKTVTENPTPTTTTHNEDDKSISSGYLKECLNKENCTQCKTETSTSPKKKIKVKNSESTSKSPMKQSKKHLSKTSPDKDQKHQGCDCIEKGLPLKLNDVNIWQVCGANDCKLVQSKIDAFEAKPMSPNSKSTDTERTVRNSFAVFPDDLETKPKNKMNGKNGKSPKKSMQSKSNFDDNSIVFHDLKQEKSHINGDSTERTKMTITSEITPLESPTDFDSNRPDENKIKGQTSRENCDDCCFCNPKLHRNSTNNSTANMSCKFCKKKESERPNTESTSRTKTDDDYRPNLTYEMLSKTDHTHTKTKIHDSDVTSTKCTKSNEKIKRKFLPDPHKLHTGSPYSAKSNISSSSNESLKRTPSPSTRSGKTTKHINRPTNREANQIPRTKSLQSIQKTDDLSVTNPSFRNKNEKNSKKSKSQNFRLPSPYVTTDGITSHKDYDSSSVSDMSLLAPSPQHHPNNNNAVAQTAANRWRGHISQKQNNARKWASREYEDMVSQRAKAKWGPKIPIDAPGNNSHQGNFIVFG